MNGDYDQIASWLDEKHGDVGDLWHRGLIDPTVLQLLGDVSRQQILELACGNGYLSRRLSRLGAHVTAVDASARMIALAEERETKDPLGVVYHVSDAARLDVLADGAFDVVVCNMGLMDIADAEGALRECSRVLRPHGRFVASLCHPCFDVLNASAWIIEKEPFKTTVWRKVRRYREIFEDWALWRIAPDEFYHTRGYHRPLAWYLRALRAAGFVVAALEEPEPDEEVLAGSSQGPFMAEVPLICVIEAWKLGEPDERR